MTKPIPLEKILAVPYRRNKTHRYDIPTALVTVWISNGPIFQQDHDLDTDDGLDKLTMWWLRSNRFDFAGVRDIVNEQILTKMHLSHLAKVSSGKTLALTPLQKLVLRHSVEVAKTYDVRTPNGVNGFWWWWLSHGAGLFFNNAEELLRDEVDALHVAHLPGISGKRNLVLTPLQHIVLAGRNDLAAAYDVAKPDTASRFWYWWLTEDGSDLLGKSLGLRKAEFDAFHLRHLTKIAASAKPSLTPLLRLVLSHRADLDSIYDANDPSTLNAVWLWWFLEGRVQLKDVPTGILEAEMDAFHFAHLSRIAKAESPMLSPLLRIVATGHTDLSTHDIATCEGIADIWRWWLHDGQRNFTTDHAWIIRREYDAFHTVDLSDFWTKRHVAPTLLVRLLLPEISKSNKAPSREDRALLWNHFFWHFAPELTLPNERLPIVTKPLSHVGAASDGLKQLIPDWLPFIYTMRPDLQTAFGLADDAAITALLRWFFAYGVREYASIKDPFGSRVRTLLQTPAGKSFDRVTPTWAGWLYRLSHVSDNPAQTATQRDVQSWWRLEGKTLFAATDRLLKQAGRDGKTAAKSAHDVVPASPRRKPQAAIALLGYAQGELGLGEDIRLLRRSLQSAGIEPAVIRAPWRIDSRQAVKEQSEEATEESFVRDVMFYTIPPSDSITLLQKAGPKAFVAPRRIGFWQWELPHLLPPFTLATELINEIWCHSEHSARAFREATDKPVIKVPLPVSVPDTPPAERRKYDIPNNAFTIFTSFDSLSSIARKNPLGAIHAFQKAFPKSDRGVRLFVKCMNPREDRLWNECLRHICLDDRIILLTKTLDRLDYYKLLRACDAILSLHRAEGFGRLMAEAMALGLPTIATAWSGNADFMTPDNSWPIDGELVPVFSGDYPFHHDQQWLEPDVDQAAAALRECREDNKLRRQKSRAGQHTITSRYSLDVCGQRYRELLGDSFVPTPARN